MNKSSDMIIREACPVEYKELGQIMVDVYSRLEGFPSPEEQPKYYHKLANVGEFLKDDSVRLLVAISPENKLLGGVLYFSDMKYYGSGGKATEMKNASGFRLLAVSPVARGMGVGKALTQKCIQLAKENNHNQLYIHTTKAMQVAWKMYEKIGFERFPELDFSQEGFPVFGFQLTLKN